jgi:hypothetical protein
MRLFLTPIIAKHLKSRNRTREVLDKYEREEIIPCREAPSEPSLNSAAAWDVCDACDEYVLRQVKSQRYF